jgi:outer membrane protein
MKCSLTAALIVSVTVIGGVAKAETMEGALARAYENNPQLNAERAAVRQADEGVAQALSGYRPTINGTASVGTQYTDTTVVVPPQPPPGNGVPPGSSSTSSLATFRGQTTPRGAGLNLSQTVFDGYQTSNKTRAAETQVSGARESLRVVEQSVLLSAAAVYMDFLRDAATVDVQRSNVRVLEKTLSDARGRFEAGDITKTQVFLIEAQLASAQAALHVARATLMATGSNYRRITGVEPVGLSPGAPVDRFLPSTLAAAIQLGLTQNPMVAAAAHGVDVALLQVKIAEGGLHPTMTLQGNVQKVDDQNILTPKLLTGSVAIGVTVPLYQGGREYSAIRQKKEATAQQRFSFDQVRDQARANVTQFWGQLDATRSRIEAAERQVRASESALNGLRGEARLGQATTLDVLNTQQTLVNARVGLVTAQHDRVLASYSLLAAVGRLSPAVLGLPVQLYDPTIHYHQVRDSWFGLRTPEGR